MGPPIKRHGTTKHPCLPVLFIVIVCLLAASSCAKWNYKISGFGAAHFFPNTKYFRQYDIKKPEGRERNGIGFGFEVQRFKNFAFSVSGVFLEDLKKKYSGLPFGNEYTEYITVSYFDLDLKYYFYSKANFHFYGGAGIGSQHLDPNNSDVWMPLYFPYPFGDWTHSFLAGTEYQFKNGLGIFTTYRFRVIDGDKLLGLSGASGGESEDYGLNCYGHEITFGISYNWTPEYF
jgi:hypothetical protein